MPDDYLPNMAPGLWLGPGEDVPAKPFSLVSALLPRLGANIEQGELICLDLVQVLTIEPPGDWAWVVLSEAGTYTYSHSIGLNLRESWRFVFWDDREPIVHKVAYAAFLPPADIARFYGADAFGRARQDRDAVQLRLTRVS